MVDDKYIIDNLKKAGILNTAAFNPKILSFSQDVRAMCEMNSCGRYNNSWNCPPAVGTLEELGENCLKYAHGILFSVVSELEDSFDFEGMMNASARFCEKLKELNGNLASEPVCESYQIFGAGSCRACKTCGYPDTPCSHPDERFVPVEACGINVVELSAKLGLPYNNGANTVTYFGMILYG